MTGKTKEQLLNHPTSSLSITTAAQARKHLIEHYLLHADQDPDHPSLSLALLNIACSAPGIMAVIVDAIRSVAILMDAIPTTMTLQEPIAPTQLDSPPVDLGAQIISLMACIEDIRKSTETNKTSADVLARTTDEGDELHSIAQFVGNSADELIDIPTQIKNDISTLPPPLAPNTIPAHPTPHHQQDDPTPNTPYRDALLTDHHQAKPTAQEPPLCSNNTRANAAIKERQILLDIDLDHPTLNGDTPCNEIVNLIQKALTNLQDHGGLSLQMKAFIHLRNGGYLIEMASAEAARWIRDLIRKLILTESLRGNVCIKDRMYNLLIPFVPIMTKVDDKSTLRKIEQTNDIPRNSITHLKWIKDP